jgi:pimeloyl-ACP methyl ester carboxylesterase
MMRIWTILCAGSLIGCTKATPVEQSYISFDGHTIAYLDKGVRDAPVVLMLHGLTGNAERNFEQTGLIAQMTAQGFRVIAPDLRGHGGSAIDNTPENWPVDAMVQDQITLLQHLEAEPHAVVGYSMGALVALRLQVLETPAQRLVLGGMGDKTAIIGDRARHDAIAALLGRVSNGETGQMETRISAMLAASKSTADSVAGSLRHRMTVTREELAAMSIPVLVINGDADFDNGDGAALAAMLPNAQFETHPGDHLSVLGDPDYGARIVAFVAED